MLFRSLTFLTMLLPMVCSSAGAQVIERPSRPFRGLFGGAPSAESADPSRVGQELTVSLNALGSYNEDPSMRTAGLLVPVSAHEPIHTASLDSAVRYVRSGGASSLGATGRGFLTSYSTVAGPIAGGDAQVHYTTTLGRVNQVGVETHARYSPLRTIGAFGSLEASVNEGASPDSNPMNGVAAGNSWVSGAVASLNRNWTARDRMGARYSYSTSDYAPGFGFDSAEDVASVDYARSFGRTFEVATSYSYSIQRLSGESGDMHPIRQEDADLGVQYRRRLSPTRNIDMSAGAGMSRVATESAITGEPFVYRSPSGHTGFSIDIGRSWAVRADFRRAITVLDGVSRQPFVTDAALLHIGGFAVGRRLELAVIGGYSSGLAVHDTDAPGQHEGYTGSAQARYAINRWSAALVSYHYYEHRLRGVADIPESVASDVIRKGVRVGVSFWLPLYGNFSTGGR